MSLWTYLVNILPAFKDKFLRSWPILIYIFSRTCTPSLNTIVKDDYLEILPKVDFWVSDRTFLHREVLVYLIQGFLWILMNTETVIHIQKYVSIVLKTIIWSTGQFVPQICISDAWFVHYCMYNLPAVFRRMFHLILSRREPLLWWYSYWYSPGLSSGPFAIHQTQN